MITTVSSFRDQQIKPLERVYKIWYSFFVLRGWRLHILKSKGKTLQKNFITSNAYTCIELNAHSIVKLMVYLTKINKPEWFLPILMSSQPCEEFFRKLRSFTSTYSTKVNFSLQEIIHRTKKIQLQGEIIRKNKGNIRFPRLGTNLKDACLHELLQNAHIFGEIVKARTDAIATLRSIGNLIEKSSPKEPKKNNTAKTTRKDDQPKLAAVIIQEKELETSRLEHQR